MADRDTQAREATGIPCQAQDRSITIKDMRYYDIMIIGRTGMGKTTTTEKLLVANPNRIDYSCPAYTEPETYGEEGNRRLKDQDLCMWRIPVGDEDAIANCTERLKRLTFYRANTADSLPHESINKFRATNSEKTVRPELFSNENTKIRVLDVRGFFGTTPIDDENPNRSDHNSHAFTPAAIDPNSAHLGTMRSILHIQASMAMNFRRILYFLPCRDVLESSSIPLREELQLLHSFFGHLIFETIIFVATLGPVSYDLVPKYIEVTFPQGHLDKCKRTIQEELEKLMRTSTPQPPIIFISLNETCESILKKVKETPVAHDGLHLQLKATVCARCSATIGEKGVEKVAITNKKDWSQSMIYEESHCHPLMIPKFSKVKKFLKGIAYVVRTVVRREAWKWPDFNAEQCIECGCAPGSLGCWPVRKKYIIDNEAYVVNHTSVVQECVVLIQEDTNEPPDPPTPPEPDSDDDIPSPSYLQDEGTFRNAQSDALVLGVGQRKPITNRIRSSVSLSTISPSQPPVPRPRTKFRNSTTTIERTPADERTQNPAATPEITPVDEPAIKSTDTSISNGDEVWENRITPSDELNQERVYQQEISAEVHSFTPSPRPVRRSWSGSNSYSNDSSRKGF